MPSDNPIDKFFDVIESVVDGTIPQGRLGFATTEIPREDGKPATILWHFALYKVSYICDETRTPPPAKYHEKLPRGGAFAFCGGCLRKTLEELKNG